MKKTGKVLAYLAAAAIIAGFILVVPLPEKVTNQEFKPGSRVVVHIGDHFTLEGTVAEGQQVNRTHKGDRLVLQDGTPTEEQAFHTAAKRR